MKLELVVFETKVPPWIKDARTDYVAKISPFLPMNLKSLKSPGADRDQADVKRRLEGEKLLAEINEKDFVVLFDEGGKLSRSSVDFSEQLRRVVESGKQKAVFCIDGAYGFSDEISKRANVKWSLSPLTMNHWLAQIVALEQIYRGFTILKGIPYHNR
jgi:23S rRNA (pseudouridine1915-N3)-methyltransferase